MDFGFYIKRNENDFVVFVPPDDRRKGYNVVPKDVDPENAIDIEEVRAYAKDNPELELPMWTPQSPTVDEIAERIREERDARIQAERWRIERYNDESILGISHTEEIGPVLSYLQALRDITKQPGFPYTIIWPQKPEESHRGLA